MLSSALNKKRAVGLVLFLVVLVLFFSFNRFPKLDAVGGDLDAVTAPQVQCFQGFCIEREPGVSFLKSWWIFSVTYLRLVTVGMTFAFVVAGLAEAFLFPTARGVWFKSGSVFGRTVRGLAVGPVMNLCSACIVPVSSAFQRRGGGIEGAIAMVQGSATLNIPALAMVFFVFTPLLGFSRLVLALVGGLVIGPIVLIAVRRGRGVPADEPELVELDVEEGESGWGPAMAEGFRDWAKTSVGYLARMGPIMVVAGFASGLAIQWVSPDTVSEYLGNDVLGVAIAATFGVLINVPLLFEIPLVALLLLLGMGTAPAATLLFTAAAGGPVTFWGLARVMPKRGIAAFATATWGLGAVGGLAVLGIGALIWDTGSPLRPEVAAASAGTEAPVAPPPLKSVSGAVPSAAPLTRLRLPPGPSVAAGSSEPPAVEVRGFTNIAPQALGDKAFIDNGLTGVAVFDYDRDGHLDFYVTQAEGKPNYLFHNEADGSFQEVGQEAGVAAVKSNSTGVAACDFDNDGYQDLYVGAIGRKDEGQDVRVVDQIPGLAEVIKDRLFHNNGDGTFSEVTDAAFGDGANLRTAGSVACADVDRDGWLDIFVANRIDLSDIHLNRPQGRLEHPGWLNVLYRNNGDLTFTDVAPAAGVKGELAVTWAALFYDFDDDGDPDLWTADDGDRLGVYRNDSAQGVVRFTPVSRAMGVDKIGAWMGFALGDYDGDADLDIFVTNIGYHPLTREHPSTPTGECAFHQMFNWGTCDHFLLRNDGTRDIPGVGPVGLFHDVAPSTAVEPSVLLPPASLDPESIYPTWQVPTGLTAYEFGWGTAFFDMENDGDQDLYWLGSAVAVGEAPFGDLFPSAGRMLRGDGRGTFQDVTVEAHLLDIQHVDYSVLDPLDPSFDARRQRIGFEFHENGKGLAKGDLNNDGYVDLIATHTSGDVLKDGKLEFAKAPIFLWMSPGGENHWIALRLKGRMAIDGTGSNADGIGARVYVSSKPNGGNELVQVDELANSSFLSMNSLDMHFGLGSAAQADQITIFWPSGVKQVLENVPADQVLAVEEPPP